MSRAIRVCSLCSLHPIESSNRVCSLWCHLVRWGDCTRLWLSSTERLLSGTIGDMLALASLNQSTDAAYTYDPHTPPPCSRRPVSRSIIFNSSSSSNEQTPVAASRLPKWVVAVPEELQRLVVEKQRSQVRASRCDTHPCCWCVRESAVTASNGRWCRPLLASTTPSQRLRPLC